MAKIDEKIAATGFTATTTLDHAAILAAADKAARQASGMVDKIQQATAPGSGFAFDIKRAGMARIGSLAIEIGEAAGQRQVTFVPRTYVTSQSRIMFIPVAPKSSAALAPMRRFSEALRKEL